jgi:alkylation response protein AidB-like acyl-CoA dehydrogenase
MYLDYTPEQQALRIELRGYFAKLGDELGPFSGPGEGGPQYRKVVRRLGKDGWLGIGWPTEFGGQGRTAMEQFIFFDEVQRAGAPFPFVTINTVGPTIMRFGSDEQKKTYLPGILAGEINFAIGYTEPEAGTDLASLKTRAVRDGDEYVINGNKVFTSGADDADYVWLACRTDPDAPKHKGISLVVVPTSSPGFKVTPIVTVGGTRTTATYYDDVRVPVDNCVGGENHGWKMITTQLNHERVGLGALAGTCFEMWDATFEWAKSTEAAASHTAPEGNAVVRMADVPWVKADLARTWAKLEAVKLLNWRMVEQIGSGEPKPADSSAVKVYATETLIDVYRTLLGIVGPFGIVREGSPDAVFRGRMEKAARAAQINTFGGGVNDVQREIIAAAGLGMKRGAR